MRSWIQTGALTRRKGRPKEPFPEEDFVFLSLLIFFWAKKRIVLLWAGVWQETVFHGGLLSRKKRWTIRLPRTKQTTQEKQQD